MKNRKLAAALLIFAFGATLLGGCAKSSLGVKDKSVLPVEEPAGGTEQAQKDKQQAVMKEFDALLSQSAKASEVIEYMNTHISLVSPENAGEMAIKLEALQKKTLPELEAKFYEGNSIQEQLFKQITQGTAVDGEVTALLDETKVGGFKVETAEGMFFPVIDYRYYGPFKDFVTADIKEYIEIMTIESDEAPAKDAALVISWEEVLERAFRQEKFIGTYKDSVKSSDIRELFSRYVSFTLYGANNTPLFVYDSGAMDPEAEAAYKKLAESSESGRYAEMVRAYMDVLYKNDFLLTEEVKAFRVKAEEELKK